MGRGSKGIRPLCSELSQPHLNLTAGLDVLYPAGARGEIIAMKLYLVRHGQSIGNKKGFVQGQKASVDLGLTELGQLQAQLVAERFAEAGITALYTSPLPRSAETASYIGQACGLEPLSREWLKEVCYGILEGLSLAETATHCPGIFDPQWRLHNDIPGGETRPDVYRRARMALQELLSGHSGDDAICAVAHGEFLSKLIDVMLGVPEIGFPRYMVANSSVTEFAHYPPGSDDAIWVCHCIGDISHIEALKSPEGEDGW
jgi:broad specificity phosphatase PhoE